MLVSRLNKTIWQKDNSNSIVETTAPARREPESQLAVIPTTGTGIYSTIIRWFAPSELQTREVIVVDATLSRKETKMRTKIKASIWIEGYLAATKREPEGTKSSYLNKNSEYIFGTMTLGTPKFHRKSHLAEQTYEVGLVTD
jgi:hypothetical protein